MEHFYKLRMSKIQNNANLYQFSQKPFELVQLVQKNRTNTNRNYNEAYRHRKLRDRLMTKNLKSICDFLDFLPRTYYKTIGLIDSVSSQFLFEDAMFKKISLVCLGLISKTQESVDKALYTNSLQLIMPGDKAEYARLEKLVLFAMEFNLNVVVPFEYVVELLRVRESFDGIKCNLYKKFRKFVLRLVRRTALDYETNKFTSLAVALAVLMTAREVFGCEEPLPSRLKVLTGYNESVLSACLEEIRPMAQRLAQKSSKKEKSFSSESTDLSSGDLSFD